MAIKKQKLVDALHEYQKYNPLRNDLDAYLYSVGLWALCADNVTKPNKEDYGIEEVE